MTDDSTIFVVIVDQGEIDTIKKRVPALGRVCDLFSTFGHVYENEHGQELFDEFKEEVLEYCVYTHYEHPFLTKGGTRVQNIWDIVTKSTGAKLQ